MTIEEIREAISDLTVADQSTAEKATQIYIDLKHIERAIEKALGGIKDVV